MEILWKMLTWTLSLVVMAASDFQSLNRLSHNSQGMKELWEISVTLRGLIDSLPVLTTALPKLEKLLDQS